MARPRPINLFALAYLIYGCVMLTHGILMGDRLGLRAVEVLGDWALPVILGSRLAIVLLLAWGVYFKASKVAKWLIVLQIVSLLLRLAQGWGGVAEGNVGAIVWTVGFVAGVTAVALLFLPASRDWFRAKGRPVKPLASIFE
jgi:hypothetical protein